MLAVPIRQRGALLRSLSILTSTTGDASMSNKFTYSTTNNSSQRRPLSPHMTIYQPQLTWLMSIGHRVTGSGLAVLIYGFGISQSISTDGVCSLSNLCELISMAPLPMVLAGKFVLAAPFMYHLLNGIRHLLWDSGRALTLRGVYTTGWIVNILTLASAGFLTFYNY